MSDAIERVVLFKPGQIVATPGALDTIERHDLNMGKLLARHLSGDWGDLDADDKRANTAALENESRILSSYGEGDAKLWIITEAVGDDGQRASTCILRPDEY